MSTMEGEKVAIVTGSGSGVGRAIAEGLAKQGYRVVVHANPLDSHEATLSEVDNITGWQNYGVTADLRKRLECKKLIDDTIAKFKRLDVLVNNTGIFLPASINDGMNAFDAYQDIIKSNLDTAVLMTLLAVPHLKQTWGCIVNISSNLDRICIYSASAYSASKAALTAYTKSCACELAPFVRVNSVSPGPIGTSDQDEESMARFREIIGGSTLIGRVGEGEDVSRVVTFLCSPESSFITGTNILVDGGSAIKPSRHAPGPLDLSERATRKRPST